MAVSSRIKGALNWCLTPLNLAIQTRTAEKQELARLLALAKRGQFERPVFPVLPQFASCDPTPIFEAIKLHRPETERFARPPLVQAPALRARALYGLHGEDDSRGARGYRAKAVDTGAADDRRRLQSDHR